jgi:RNA polymerase sigma-70 factor (ECF subfamily)
MSRGDEARWADRLIAGDSSAFRDFVEAYKRKVYGLAYEMTRNHSDAEDISQVAFMKVHRAIGTIRPGHGLNTWLYQIVYNTAIDHIRKRPFYPQAALSSLAPELHIDGPPDPAARPEQAAEAACLRRRITRPGQVWARPGVSSSSYHDPSRKIAKPQHYLHGEGYLPLARKIKGR